MSDHDKDNISQFFHKAVQKPKIRFVESDWEKLEARLDKASMAGAPKPNRWKTAFIVAVALLFVSTALLLYTGRQAKTLAEKTELNNVNANPTSSTSPSSTNEKPSERQDLKKQDAKKPDENRSHSSLLSNVIRKEVKAQRMNNTLAEKTELNDVNKHPTLSTSPSSKNEKLSERQDLKNQEVKKPDENRSQSSLLSDVTRKEIKVTPTNNITEVSAEPLTALPSDATVNKEASFQHIVSSDKVNDASAKDQFSDKEVTSQSLAVDSSSVKKKGTQKDTLKNKTSLKDSLDDLIKPKPSRWNVMLSLSPDFSTTDLDKFTTPGAAFGIAAYYSINRAFSISAGVVKSRKLYWDSGDDYKPVDPGFWSKRTNGIVPGKIEGSCSVLEIPLGLQYYVASTKKNKLYFATTFSSYIMLKESYQYIFDSPNPGAMQTWNAKKISYSLFSIANLTVGYERSISNRLMIGVSPYIKIPLSGIGAWANVKLYSMGAAFTLRYQFQKKKKPDLLIPAD